jgi:hypothetical protein
MRPYFAHTVKISYPPEAVIHPTFDKPFTIWNGERVQVGWTPSLRAESFKYLVAYDRVLLEDSIRQGGLHKESKISGKGTPLVVYAENPRTTPEESHYPASGIALAITAVHGLISSPISWQNLANDLCSDPKILEHYQPWFFLYPTGQPALESDLPIKVPFHSTIGNRGIDNGPDSSDGVVAYRSSHLEGAESEKIIPAGHNLLSNPGTVAEIKRILEANMDPR